MTIRALLFDVFGTLADWRGSIAREAEIQLSLRGYSLDWLAFADAWRGEYQPSMARIREGKRGYVKLDILHRENLERILPRFGIPALEPALMDELNRIWHRLALWPDVAPGLARLGQNFHLAPCSNGNIALMADLARVHGLRWDAILGAEIARDYKPKPEVYRASCEAFNLAPEEVMMVAAHSNDLAAAAAIGMKTAHIARLDEYGPGTGEASPLVVVDFAARDLLDLGNQLGLGN